MQRKGTVLLLAALLQGVSGAVVGMEGFSVVKAIFVESGDGVYYRSDAGNCTHALVREVVVSKRRCPVTSVLWERDDSVCLSL